MTELSKKAEQQARQDFDLAVRLIMKQDGVPIAKARFIAWLEGEEGLQQRLGQPRLPLTTPGTK